MLIEILTLLCATHSGYLECNGLYSRDAASESIMGGHIKNVPIVDSPIKITPSEPPPDLKPIQGPKPIHPPICPDSCPNCRSYLLFLSYLRRGIFLCAKCRFWIAA